MLREAEPVESDGCADQREGQHEVAHHDEDLGSATRDAPVAEELAQRLRQNAQRHPGPGQSRLRETPLGSERARAHDPEQRARRAGRNGGREDPVEPGRLAGPVLRRQPVQQALVEAEEADARHQHHGRLRRHEDTPARGAIELGGQNQQQGMRGPHREPAQARERAPAKVARVPARTIFRSDELQVVYSGTHVRRAKSTMRAGDPRGTRRRSDCDVSASLWTLCRKSTLGVDELLQNLDGWNVRFVIVCMEMVQRLLKWLVVTSWMGLHGTPLCREITRSVTHVHTCWLG
jgi:hypothetical protein